MPTVSIAIFLLLLGSACGSEDPRSVAPIEAAVEEYLATRTDLNLGQLRVRADHVQYEGQQAVAEVSITAPGDPKAAMKMVYELQRGADGWRVLPEPSSGGGPADPGPSPRALPRGHPPIGQPDSGLPPGHPPLEREENP